MDIVTHRYSCYIFPEQLYLVFLDKRAIEGKAREGKKR